MEEQVTRNKQAIEQIYNTVLPLLAEQVNHNLMPVIPLFENFVLERLLDTWTKDPAGDPSEEISLEKGNIQQLGLKLRLEGFNKAGIEPFDISKSLLFKLELHSYTVGPEQRTTWLEKEYLKRWEQSDYERIAEKWSEEIIDSITIQIEAR
jgi:hypothetical protein